MFCFDFPSSNIRWLVEKTNLRVKAERQTDRENVIFLLEFWKKYTTLIYDKFLILLSSVQSVGNLPIVVYKATTEGPHPHHFHMYVRPQDASKTPRLFIFTLIIFYLIIKWKIRIYEYIQSIYIYLLQILKILM